MVDDYVLDKMLEKIKEIIGIARLDKLSDDVTFKNIAILVTCIIIDYGKLQPEIIQKKYWLISEDVNNKTIFY